MVTLATSEFRHSIPIGPRPAADSQRLTTNHFIQSAPDQHSSLIFAFLAGALPIKTSRYTSTDVRCSIIPSEIMTIGTQLGSYELTALLGKGGMGEVYRARDRKLKRDVAIKILPEEFSL